MKVRIVKQFSKETGKFLGFTLETSDFPFIWKRVQEYHTESDRQVEHDALWLLELEGKVKRKDEYL